MSYSSGVTRGAASELIASAHLMSLGYHVFRSASPACPVDLIAYRDGEQPKLVEVKTITVSMEKKTVFHTKPQNDDWDWLVAVGPDNRVFVFDKEPTNEERRDILRIAYGLSASTYQSVKV